MMKTTKRKIEKVHCPLCESEFRNRNPKKPGGMQNELRLDPNTGIYACLAGHAMTLDELTAASLKGPTAATEKDKTDTREGPKNGVENQPENGLENGLETGLAEKDFGVSSEPEAEAYFAAMVAFEEAEKEPETPSVSAAVDEVETGLSARVDEGSAILPLKTGEESSQSRDDVKPEVPQPNGDLEIRLVIRECDLGPMQELAAGYGQTLTEWVQGNMDQWVSDYLVVPGR